MIAHCFRFALIVGTALCCEAVTLLHASARNVIAAPARPSTPRMDQSAEVLPRVIFLNQSAVLIAAKKNNIKYKQHQARLIELMSKGVTILICPDCMKTYGVTEADLIDGIQMGQRHN